MDITADQRKGSTRSSGVRKQVSAPATPARPAGTAPVVRSVTVAGDEVRTGLRDLQARLTTQANSRVLLVEFSGMEPGALQALADNIANVASSMATLLVERQPPQVLARLAEAMLPNTPPSPHLLKEAAMLVRARTAVLQSGDWLTAAQVAELAGLSTRNPSAQPNKWKKQGAIFAIHHAGVDYFPGFGLDREAGFRPLKDLAKIIEIFRGHRDSWEMAYWFASANSFLGAKRPQDLLAKAPQRVIAAAEDEVQGIAHG